MIRIERSFVQEHQRYLKLGEQIISIGHLVTPRKALLMMSHKLFESFRLSPVKDGVISKC